MFDVLVADWLKAKFLASGDWGYGYPEYDKNKHGEPSEISVTSADAGWDCYCYSSYTRDDQFELTAIIKTRAGNVEFRYGRWGDFPDFIEELDEYRNGNECYYESQEYLDD